MELGYVVINVETSKYHEGGHGFSKKLVKAMVHNTLEEAQERRDYAWEIFGKETPTEGYPC